MGIYRFLGIGIFVLFSTIAFGAQPEKPTTSEKKSSHRVARVSPYQCDPELLAKFKDAKLPPNFFQQTMSIAQEIPSYEIQSYFKNNIRVFDQVAIQFKDGRGDLYATVSKIEETNFSLNDGNKLFSLPVDQVSNISSLYVRSNLHGERPSKKELDVLVQTLNSSGELKLANFVKAHPSCITGFGRTTESWIAKERRTSLLKPGTFVIALPATYSYTFSRYGAVIAGQVPEKITSTDLTLDLKNNGDFMPHRVTIVEPDTHAYYIISSNDSAGYFEGGLNVGDDLTVEFSRTPYLPDEVVSGKVSSISPSRKSICIDTESKNKMHR